MSDLATIIVPTSVALLSGVGGAWIAAQAQRPKVRADAELTAVQAATQVLQELRTERDDLRHRIEVLEADADVDRRAIVELRAAEEACQRRLARAVQVMRDNGLDVPDDLIGRP